MQQKIDNNEKIISLFSNNGQMVKKVSRFQKAGQELISNQKKLMDSN